jgi:hypothetical protein
MKELACIGGHRFDLPVSAMRAGELAQQYDFSCHCASIITRSKLKLPVAFKGGVCI